MQELQSKEYLFQIINQAYEEMDFELGWSLLYGKFENLWNPKYPIAFFGLNLGGKINHGFNISNEKGSSYLCEDWGAGIGKSPLQLQIASLYKAIANSLGPTIKYEDLLNNSMATNFVPFRSANWEELNNKSRALEFSNKLWKERINLVPCSLYLTISKEAFNQILRILIETDHVESSSPISKKVGWGNVTYQINQFTKTNKKVVLIRLPHLSTYKIFSNERCMSAINHLVSIAASHLEIMS